MEQNAVVRPDLWAQIGFLWLLLLMGRRIQLRSVGLLERQQLEDQ